MYKAATFLLAAALAAPGIIPAQTPAFAPRAILADGPGPWRDERWDIAATEFNRLLTDAGYTVATVSPIDLASVLAPDILLAAPSLESLPASAFQTVDDHLNSGGSLMASGGEPFRDPLYLTPGGQWVTSAAYENAVGSPPQKWSSSRRFETLTPWSVQYTASSGVRVPVARSRGLSAWRDSQGRYRAIGDPLAPAATLYVASRKVFISFSPSNTGSLIIWLPWPQLSEPLRAQLVAALRAARHRLFLLNSGPEQIVGLPGEEIKGRANILNAAGTPVQATLQWSVSGAGGTSARSPVPLSFPPEQEQEVPLDIGPLPNGDYTLSTRLMVGGEEVDRIDSPIRVLDPALLRQPDQKIRVVDGAFYAGGRRVFLQGVNYWPRYVAGLESYRFNDSWLQPAIYDPELVEADLSLIASLHFNLVNIKYVDLQQNWFQQGRTLIDFLERCRNHGLWVNIALPAMVGNVAYAAVLNPNLGAFLAAAYLPGNDRVFAYDLLWEPFVGAHDRGGPGRLLNGTYENDNGRLALDPDWRAWVDEQYGSLAQAEQIWGFSAPRNAGGQLTNPLDDQITSDGPWRIMVAAYRRFMEDYFGRNLGVMTREIRRLDPDTLLTFRNWSTMTSTHNFYTGYDIGTAAAHLNFASPERWEPELPKPDDPSLGLIVDYSRYRTGAKPVHWAEFGYDVGLNNGTPASRAAQAYLCDRMMREVAEDGSSAASVWWWPGGTRQSEDSDYGIIDSDGAPRDCAWVLAQWGETFAAAPPEVGSGTPVTLTVDRDADARGSYGLFLNLRDRYIQARKGGHPVTLVNKGTGTDTSTMPLTQVGNAPYAGVGPLQFANAEFGGIRIVCPGLDVTVENNAQVQIPPGAACQVTPTLVNTGEAGWLPASAPKGGVILHTNAGDAPLTASIPWLRRTAMGPLAVTMGQNPATLTGRLRIQGVGDFGELLNVTLAVDSTVAGPCAISLSSSNSITAPPEGATGAINIVTAAGCAWQASSPQPWATVTPASGTGSGAVNYVIQPNPHPARQTSIMVAGHPFTVTQMANPNPALVKAPALSATSLNFGRQTVGITSGAQAVMLTNIGDAALMVAVATGGANSADFAPTNTCAPVLAPAAVCRIDVTFTPSGAGTRTASLFIGGNISGGPLIVSLSGTGTDTGPTPVIQAIVDAWAYTAGIAPGQWVTIGGTNMAGPPQSWNLSRGQQLPVNIAGVTVTFNGTPAALLYVSPSQLNTLVPAPITPGPVQVVVEKNGVRSSPLTTIATATQPAVYAPPSTDGTSFVTAALQGTALLVGNAATDSRVVRAVYPGDIVDLYMIGLGATADPSKFVTDRLFSGAFPVSAHVTATVGGKPAPVLFAGLTTPGLYLVRISIPADLAAGPQPIQVSADGAHTPSPLVLMVGTAPADLIRNGSFESALTGDWNFSVDGSSGTTASIQRTPSTSAEGVSSALITVTSAAKNTANAAAVQLSQAGFPVQQEQVYRLQFWAKADTARTLRFSIVQNGGDFQNYGLDSAVPLSGDWQRYVIYFQATASGPVAQLNFYLGDQTGNTWLDALVLHGTAP